MQEEVDKNADLLKRLVEAETQAAENKRKAANLEKVSEELQITREDLARLRKEAEDAEVKAAARIAELEKKCKSMKDSSVEMAKAGYTRCLSQALVLEPSLQTQYMHLSHRAVDGKILSKDGVVYPLPEAEEVAAGNDAENLDAGGDGIQTPVNAAQGEDKSPGDEEPETGEN